MLKQPALLALFVCYGLLQNDRNSYLMGIGILRLQQNLCVGNVCRQCPVYVAHPRRNNDQTCKGFPVLFEKKMRQVLVNHELYYFF